MLLRPAFLAAIKPCDVIIHKVYFYLKMQEELNIFLELIFHNIPHDKFFNQASRAVTQWSESSCFILVVYFSFLFFSSLGLTYFPQT
jgi:hypothetical protein